MDEQQKRGLDDWADDDALCQDKEGWPMRRCSHMDAEIKRRLPS